MITENEKSCLMFIYENPRLPVAWSKLELKDRDATVAGLVAAGLINERHAFTMRGICHLVVDCQVPFTQVLKVFGEAFRYMTEIETAKKALQTDEAFNIFYYYNFKQYLEWDLFDERHSWKKMPKKELLKVFVEIGLKLIDDGRIPHEKYFDLLGVPVKLMKDMAMTKEQAKHVLQMTLSYL